MGPSTCRRALLALHGGPGLSHESMRALDALASDQRCIIYFDQRGIGGSSSPQGRWRVEDLVADVDAVRAHWGFARVDLIGHSWGAYLATAYASANPHRVRHMVLSSPAPLTLSGWSDFEAEMHARIHTYEASGRIRPRRAEDERGDDCSASTERVLPAYLFDPDFEPAPGPHLACSRHGFARTWSALPKEDLADTAHGDRKRALFVQGEGEATRDAIREEWLHHHRGRLQTVVIPQCGHVLHTECPEAWLSVIADAL